MYLFCGHPYFLECFILKLSFVEQIRLHIIAMHELCEYNKGEGFSEGFDAHLNIEQMNKHQLSYFKCMMTIGEKVFSSQQKRSFGVIMHCLS